jgi:hypothetical protein
VGHMTRAIRPQSWRSRVERDLIPPRLMREILNCMVGLDDKTEYVALSWIGFTALNKISRRPHQATFTRSPFGAYAFTCIFAN